MLRSISNLFDFRKEAGIKITTIAILLIVWYAAIAPEKVLALFFN